MVRRSTSLRAGLLIGSLLASGCDRAAATRRYDVSGSVRFDGKPTPAGRMLFSPDPDHGKGGVATVADIREGVFRTRPGKGALEGTYVVTIIGSDGSMATEETDNSLFPPYQTRLTIDARHTRFDLVVPRDGRAAAGSP